MGNSNANNSSMGIMLLSCSMAMAVLLLGGGLLAWYVFYYKPGGGGGGGKVTCPRGKIWDGKDGCMENNCPRGKMININKKCVPLVVESPSFGGSGGSYKYNECPKGDYISAINVGYDHAVKEIKYVAAGCAGGKTWVTGREAPSNIVKKIMDTVGVPSFFVKDSDYDNRLWRDPANPGWDRVGLVTQTGEHSGSRVRAFGPVTDTREGGMFGINDNVRGTRELLQKDKISWNCGKDGIAPPGKRYALTGIGTGSGTAIDRIQFTCKVLDVLS